MKYLIVFWVILSSMLSNFMIKERIKRCSYISPESAVEIIKYSLYFPIVIVAMIGNSDGVKSSDTCDGLLNKT